jgi:iron complex outermembrane receptor protein
MAHAKLALSLSIAALLGSQLLAQEPDTASAAIGDTAATADDLKKLALEDLMNVVVTSVSRRAEPLSEVASAIQVITQDDIRRSSATSLPEALRLAANLQVAQVDSRQWAISARGFNNTIANKLLVMIDGRTVYTPLYSGVFWDVQDVPLSDIDRIEVISGPGATLWGANAVNGVINVITKRPTETQGLLLSGGGGTALQGFGTARYGGMLGSAVSYRAYASGFARDGAELPAGTEADDAWHMGQGGLRAQWQASEASRVTLQSDYYQGRMHQTSGQDVDVTGGNALARWSRALSPTSDLRVQVYYDRTERDIPGTFAQDLDTYDVDFQHRFALGTRHNIVWGLGYRIVADHVTNGPTLAFLPADVTRDWYTGFVQDEIALVPGRLNAALGTKVEHNDYTGFELQPSGRLSLKIGPAGMLWGGVSRALRTPSRFDRELFAPGQSPYLLAGGPDFRSEQMVAYELGYRVRRGLLGVALSTFYNRYLELRSVEQANPPDPLPVVIGNGLDGQSYGAELTADYQLADWWRVRAGYTEMRVNLWRREGSTASINGSGESQSPDRQFLLSSSADLPARLRVDGNFRYVSELPDQQVPGYAELDTRLTWNTTNRLALSVAGQNLLHRRHVEFGSPTRRRTIERSVHGSVEWHF